ncbi:MAG: DUF2723 domain-containing protein [Kofleriaceae bacterium]
MKRWLVERGGGLALGVLVFYLWVASPYITENDNAEFSTLGSIGGIAHPSGYPSTILWLRLFSWLPTSAANSASIATAVLGALTILTLHAACRAWGARPFAATIATAIFAAAPLVARYFTAAEAFALNQLVVALVVWLAAVRGPLTGEKRVLVLAIVAGIGLSNHMTCALIAPVGLLGVVRGVREANRRVLAIGLAVLGLVIGLAPYLYLFIAPANLQSWNVPSDVSGLLDIALRRQYGGAFTFANSDQPVELVTQLGAFAASVGRSWLWLLPVLGVVTLAHRCAVRRDDGDGEPRIAWGLLALALLLSGPFLATRFDVPMNWFGYYIVHRFHLMPILLLAIPIACGLDSLGRWLPQRSLWGTHARRTGLGVVVFAVLAFASLPYLARFHSPAMERFVRNTLRALPPDAVIIGNTNIIDVGTRYLQLTQGERPDILFFRGGGVVELDWYRQRFARYGIRLAKPPGRESPFELTEQIFALGRPLFVHSTELLLLGNYPSYPYGTLVRVLPRGTQPPPSTEILTMNRDLFARYDLDYATPGPDDEVLTSAHGQYVTMWQSIGQLLRRDGKVAEAAWAFDLARQLAPR